MTVPTTFNPTVFIVTDKHDKRIPMNNRTEWQFHIELLEKWGYLYGSYYRPGSFWDEHVFVCPHCAHATHLEEDDKSDEFYCKYCYTDWKVENGRMLMSQTSVDDDGEETDSVWS